MKLAIALGGFLGFVMVVGAGLAVNREPAQMLLEAGIGCVIGGVLFRWLHGVLARNLHSSIMQRRHAQAAAAAATAATVAPASKPHGSIHVSPAAKS